MKRDSIPSLCKIGQANLSQYESYLCDLIDVSPSTIRNYLSDLRQFMAWYEQTSSAGQEIPQSFVPNIIATPTITGYRAYLQNSLKRAAEVCTLRPEQVHLGKRSGILKVYGKRNKYREVPLNATARAVLVEYNQTQSFHTNYLFSSEKTGEALTERALGYLVKKYAHLASISDVSPHDLRHRFGYRMAQVVPIHRLAQIMGHDSLDTTMIYIRGTQGDLQREVEKIAWE
jgi:integrase/recombinase XerD